jgi:hypothetical protein
MNQLQGIQHFNRNKKLDKTKQLNQKTCGYMCMPVKTDSNFFAKLDIDFSTYKKLSNPEG